MTVTSSEYGQNTNERPVKWAEPSSESACKRSRSGTKPMKDSPATAIKDGQLDKERDTEHLRRIE